MNQKYEKKISFVYFSSIVILFVVLGLGILYFKQNSFDILIGAFFLVLGISFMFFIIKINKSFDSDSKLPNYDERSEINRLKAADFSFKFLFVFINALILLHAINPLPVEVFVAILSPIVAFSIMLYLGYYYYNERRLE